MEHLNEKSKLFLIPTDEGQIIKAYPKSTSDFITHIGDWT